MLKIIQTLQTLAFDGPHCIQVILIVRMSLVGELWIDPAKDLAHDIFRFKPHIAKSLSGYCSGQETAHRLLSTSIRIIDQVWKRIQHGDGHAWCDLNRQTGRIAFS